MQTEHYLMRKLFICFRHSLRTCSLKSPSICAATCRFCSNIYRKETHIVTGIELVSKNTMVSKNLITLFGNYLLINSNNSKKENKQKVLITLCFVRNRSETLKVVSLTESLVIQHCFYFQMNYIYIFIIYLYFTQREQISYGVIYFGLNAI